MLLGPGMVVSRRASFATQPASNSSELARDMIVGMARLGPVHLGHLS